MSDIEVPQSKPKLLEEAAERTAIIETQYHRGLITEDERYSGVVEAWLEATDRITDTLSETLDRYGSIPLTPVSPPWAGVWG